MFPWHKLRIPFKLSWKNLLLKLGVGLLLSVPAAAEWWEFEEPAYSPFEVWSCAPGSGLPMGSSSFWGPTWFQPQPVVSAQLPGGESLAWSGASWIPDFGQVSVGGASLQWSPPIQSGWSGFLPVTTLVTAAAVYPRYSQAFPALWRAEPVIYSPTPQLWRHRNKFFRSHPPLPFQRVVHRVPARKVERSVQRQERPLLNQRRAHQVQGQIGRHRR